MGRRFRRFSLRRAVMDFLTAKAPSRLTARLHIFTRVLGAALFLIIAMNLGQVGLGFHSNGETIPTLHIPLYAVPFVFALCSLGECLVPAVVAQPAHR